MRRPGLDAQVGNTVRKLVGRMVGFTTLHLGIQRDRGKPRLRWVTDLSQRPACIGKKEPGALVVVGKHLADAIRSSSEQACAQPRLECLNGRTRLEPGNPGAEPHPKDSRPRCLVNELDGA